MMKIVAVSACSAGIAHTYMAAEGLKKSAKKAGDEIKVEIQGSMGLEHRLNQKDIDEADLVLFVTNINIREKDRFKDKNVIMMDPGQFIGKPDESLLHAKEKGGFA
ncbi:PTS fructose transporter subunit IIB [Chloroflexota bacterium]|nr:PTS fructose transporter subunit IIB [Chloroflexota bacterium]